jgi:hypothetical protein
MPANPPVVTTGTVEPGEIDPMLDAIRQAIVDSDIGALVEFGPRQVVVVSPQETEQSIDALIKQGMAMNKGLCLLLIGGSATNPNKEEEGPVLTLELEAQLYVSSRTRGKAARPIMAIITELAKFLHHARIRPSSAHWTERIYCTGFEPFPDPEYTAYSIRFEREITL